VGKKIEEIMPKNKRLRNIINYSYEFFKDRSLEGLMLWPWGASGEVKLKKYNKESVLIGGIDLICGMGKALGMIVVQPKGATGEWDSALHNKLEGVLEYISTANNIIVHVNGFDELSHRKDFKGKMQFLEKVKNELLFPLLNLKGVNIRITCDHRTDSFTGSHEKGYVPYLSISN
jgi:2,3-bisphosphoglycerate-independent phosphoglycerate mutase